MRVVLCERVVLASLKFLSVPRLVLESRRTLWLTERRAVNFDSYCKKSQIVLKHVTLNSYNRHVVFVKKWSLVSSVYPPHCITQLT